MFVMFTDEQILASQQVCQGCLLADATGSPRWHHGKLCCGRLCRGNVPTPEELLAQQDSSDSLPSMKDHLPELYECKMGFRVAYIR